MTLVNAMRRVLADTFLMYTHAHIAHWNVISPGFPQYHKFLNHLYDDLFEAIDGVAEHIRPLGALAPDTLAGLTAAATIEDVSPGTSWDTIRQRMIAENNVLIAELGEAFRLAQAAGNQGLCNFLADRLDRHAKHGWMLDASR